jgi:outer membrane biosynthesis protein TonB
VKSWEFKPAKRDGAPVDIDVVLEIPFSLPPQIAQRSQP